MSKSWTTRIGTAAAIILLTVSILFLFTFVLLPHSARALSTLQVDRTDPSCSDVTGLPAFCTIQAALNAASNGDTIEVSGHTYTESPERAGIDVTITGAGAGTTIVQAATERALATTRVFSFTGGVHVTINDLTVRHGNPPTGYGTVGGGGIYVEGSLTLDHVDVVSNTADDGGGVYVRDDTIVTGGTFRDNYGTHACCSTGGGLFAGGNLDLDGTQFINNSTYFEGGGAYVYGYAHIENALFQENVARTSSGGGLFVDDGDVYITNTLFLTNTAQDGGGGAFVWYGGVSLNGSLFQGNVATTMEGGGLFMYEGHLTANDTHFIGNRAASASQGVGGGAWLMYDATLEGGSFERNAALQNGGGLYIEQGALHMSGTLFLTNTARSGGGAWIGGYYDNSTLYGGEFSGNQASNLNGGGLLVYSTTHTVFVTGTQFQGNTASWFGGGVHAGGSLALTDAQFSHNTATNGEGGAVWVNRDVAAATTVFESNYAGSRGGGLMSWDGAMEVDRCHFIANSAGNAGGGLAHQGQSSVVNSLFARNQTPLYGAAMFLQPYSMPMTLLHNTIAGPSTSPAAAIRIGQGAVFITNNIVSDYVIGIEVVGGTVSEDYNLFYPATMVTGTGPIAHGSHSLVGDPLFFNPAVDDYHLLPISPAKDSGANLGVVIDLDGLVRPMDYGYERGCYEVPGLYGGDVELSKSSEPQLVYPGYAITYTLAYTSNGPGPGSEVWITDTLPAGVTYLGSIDDAGWIGPSVSGQTVTWYTPTLDAGASGQIVFAGEVSLLEPVSADWVLTNSAEITAAIDITPTNNLSQAVNVFQGLRIRKSHYPATITAAWDFWYYVDVTNRASSPATNLVVTDTLPAGVAAYSVQPDMGGVFDGVNTVVWTIPSLGPYATVRLTIKARTYSTQAGNCLTNNVIADSAQAAPPVSASDTTCVVKGEITRPTPTPTPTPLPTPTGTTVVIQRGGPGNAEDTYIYRYQPFVNYWLGPLLKVGYKQTNASLIQFDLSPIPSGVKVDEAWIEVWAAGWSGPFSDLTIGAYAISKTVQISQTTWVSPELGSLWAMPGANHVLLDRRPLPESTITTSGPLKWYRFEVSKLVQEWLDASTANNGVLLRCESCTGRIIVEIFTSPPEGGATVEQRPGRELPPNNGIFLGPMPGNLCPYTYFFASSEYSNPALWPRLVVRYE
jgi:uncharacterized repeat protein (TIGR01451 family)